MNFSDGGHFVARGLGRGVVVVDIQRVEGDIAFGGVGTRTDRAAGVVGEELSVLVEEVACIVGNLDIGLHTGEKIGDFDHFLSVSLDDDLRERLQVDLTHEGAVDIEFEHGGALSDFGHEDFGEVFDGKASWTRGGTVFVKDHGIVVDEGSGLEIDVAEFDLFAREYDAGAV